MASHNHALKDSEESILEQAMNTGSDPLRDVPEELQIHLGAALDWMENRTEAFDGGVRVALDGDVVEFREWKTQDLISCFDVDEPESEPYREAVTALALLLKVREDLETLDLESGAAPSEEDIERFSGNTILFTAVLDRIQRAIDGSVLRGSLVGARNLSRFRDLVGTYRQRVMDGLESAQQLRREERRKTLKSTGKEFQAPSIGTQPKKNLAARRQKTQNANARAAKGKAKARKRARAVAADDRIQPFPFLFCAVVVMALVHWGITLHGKSIVTPEPSLDRAAYERILNLENTFTAGGILYATIGEDWREIQYRDRLDRFQRLHQRAELAGYDGIILTDTAGDFAARWTRGGDTQVWAN